MKTEAQKRANAKYLKNYEDIKIRVPKGDRARYKAYAEAQDKSLNALIIELLERDIKNTGNF